jgi:phosphopentomutase
MKKAVIIVIDSLGIGAMDDASDYGDSQLCNTLANLAKVKQNIKLPNLQKLGIGNLTVVENVDSNLRPLACYGVLNELSKGKDSTIGHWELAGMVSEKGFNTYPDGFPKEMVSRFLKATGIDGYYGNKPGSGTAIIEEYNMDHKKTGYPIIYTSADSVFQIAVNTAIVSLETLYSWCEIARQLLDEGYNCSRVIARPYRETDKGLERESSARRDYSVPPPAGSLLDRVVAAGGRVTAVGKIEDLFVGQGITHSIHTGDNSIGLATTISLLESNVEYKTFELMPVESPKMELIFVNLVDTDMIFGHRRDPMGYALALEEIDRELGKIIPLISAEDLLIITADHGCDPTASGTDHTREKVPFLMYNPQLNAIDLGEKVSFTYVATIVANWLGIEKDISWVN